MAAAVRGEPAFVSQRPSGTREGSTAGVRSHRLVFSSIKCKSRCLELTGGWGLLRPCLLLLQPLVQSRGELGGVILSGGCSASAREG